MKNIGFKLTLLTFFIALLTGYYMNLPLFDNLIRSFVIYVVFSVVYLGITVLFNQIALENLKHEEKYKKKSQQEKLDQANPNMAK